MFKFIYFAFRAPLSCVAPTFAVFSSPAPALPPPPATLLLIIPLAYNYGLWKTNWNNIKVIIGVIDFIISIEFDIFATLSNVRPPAVPLSRARSPSAASFFGNKKAELNFIALIN